MGKPFWETLEDRGDALAVDEPHSGLSWSYRSLALHVNAMAESAGATPRGVAFLFGENDVGGLVGYLSCLLAGHAVYMVSTRIDHPSVSNLVERYRPELILTRLPPAVATLGGQYSCASWGLGYQRYVRKNCHDRAPNPDLALLLSTSASTGNPKTVRISRNALAASANQVIEALGVTSDDHAVTSLPFTHVYGLSVVNSHLGAGARLTLEKRSVADPGFWMGRAKSPWSSLAGVTVTYDVMRQRRVDAEVLRGVRKLLHSGSRMPADVFSWLYETSAAKTTNIYLMYGQTEACGRMCVLDPARLPDLASSVGSPVAGGRVAISSDQQITYSGPNVMMGYARGREDLDGADQVLDVLPTGDCGYLDANGMLFVTGRAGRTCKVFGQRICLDDIEDFFRSVSPTAALSRDDRIVLYCEAPEDELRGKLVALAKVFRVPPQSFVLRRLQSLPRTETGKVCYRDLGEEREGS